MYQVITIDPDDSLVFESDDIDQAFAVAYSFTLNNGKDSLIWNNSDCILEETICLTKDKN